MYISSHNHATMQTQTWHAIYRQRSRTNLERLLKTDLITERHVIVEHAAQWTWTTPFFWTIIFPSRTNIFPGHHSCEQLPHLKNTSFSLSYTERWLNCYGKYRTGAASHVCSAAIYKDPEGSTEREEYRAKRNKANDLSMIQHPSGHADMVFTSTRPI